MNYLFEKGYAMQNMFPAVWHGRMLRSGLGQERAEPEAGDLGGPRVPEAAAARCAVPN